MARTLKSLTPAADPETPTLPTPTLDNTPVDKWIIETDSEFNGRLMIQVECRHLLRDNLTPGDLLELLTAKKLAGDF